MAVVIFPTDCTIRGIWLLDKGALKEFDGIVDDYAKKLGEVKKEDMEREAKKKIREAEIDSRYDNKTPEEKKDENRDIRRRVASSFEFTKDEHVLTIECKSDKKLTGSSFSEMEHDPHAKDVVPTKFTLSLVSGRISVQLKMLNYGDFDFNLRVSPDTASSARECFSVLKEWVERHRLHRAYRIWSEFLPIWVASWFWLIMVTLLVALETPSSHLKEHLRGEAINILQGGLKPENERRALELILSLQVGVNPAEPQAGSPAAVAVASWFWLVLGFAILFGTILMLPPKTSIAVGKGVSRVAWWRWWNKVVWITAPSLIVSVILVPVLRTIVLSLF